MIAKIKSFVLFWIGDGLSRLMHIPGMGWIYPAYNWCMLTSGDIEERAGIEFMWRSSRDD